MSDPMQSKQICNLTPFIDSLQKQAINKRFQPNLTRSDLNPNQFVKVKKEYTTGLNSAFKDC
jgi:cAMP phosphodiesterase